MYINKFDLMFHLPWINFKRGGLPLADLPLSYGISDIKVDAEKLNVLEFWWDPSKDAGIFIKVHCISTEFTARKHGGERGVPFRVQIETYADDGYENMNLQYCASCQVKVFKVSLCHW